MVDHPTQSSDPVTAPATSRGRVFDRRILPPGVVPRHLQRWVLIGIALVMVGILAVSGPTTPTKPSGSTPAGASAVDPNQERIEEYQRRIQEQAQRLAAEQAQLQQTKDAFAAPAANSPAFASPPGDDDSRDRIATGASGIDAREERARFADNVAFSRPAPLQSPVAAPIGEPSAAAPAPGATASVNTTSVDESPGDAPSTGSVAALGLAADRATPIPLPSALPPPAAPTSSASAPASSAPPAAPASPRPVTPAPPGEPRYRVYEGTVIEAVLTNRLDGTFSGPVNCLVSVPVYAADHVVIPAGARVLGDARPVNTFGQTRLAVTFHRVILPNGRHIELDGFHGLNQIGDLGLRDQVDRHYAQIFGVSLALGAIAGFAQGQSATGLDATALDTYRQGAAASMSQSSTRVLDRFLNLLPTVTIREGHRIKVYLSNDLELPAYRLALASAGGHP